MNGLVAQFGLTVIGFFVLAAAELIKGGDWLLFAGCAFLFALLTNVVWSR